MKAIALKLFVSLAALFAGYYVCFLGSIFHDLFFPAPHEFCDTGDVWALEGGAIFFAPLAVIGSFGLWFVGKQRQTVGVGFRRIGKVSIIVLAICIVANLLVFLPNWDRITFFGLFALMAMLVTYAFEARNHWFIIGFAGACALGSIYGFLEGAWPFGAVWAIWACVAFHRWKKSKT